MLSNRLLILLILGIMFISSSLWVWQSQINYTNLEQQVDDESTIISTELKETFAERFGIIQTIMLQQWTGNVTEEEISDEDRFATLASHFYEFFGGYEAINWIDNDGIIRWTYPVNPNIINQSVLFTANQQSNHAFFQANQSGSIALSPVIELYQGNTGVAGYVPIFFQGSQYGYFNVVVDVHMTIDIYKSHHTNFENYAINLYENGSLFYQQQYQIDREGLFVVQQDIIFYNISWDFLIQPLEEDRENALPLSTVYIPIGGLLLIIMLIVVVRIDRQHHQERENYQKQLRQTEKVLQQYEKMEALGRLAGGIAHDFNNTLMAIQGNISLVRMLTEEGDEKDQQVIESLTSTEKIIAHARELTDSILRFSHQGNIESDFIDPQQILQDTVALFKNTLDRRIAINADYHSLPPNYRICANHSRLTQVLLNILNNARDAITDQGTIEVSMTLSTAQSDDKIIIQIRDDGEGIYQDTLSQVFDPFFTTKDVGEGTGLGLSMAYQYITSMGGMIDIGSEVGVGTVVTMSLPIMPVDNPMTLHNEVKQQIKPPEEMRLLLVEDEEQIAATLERLLNNQGYSVVSCNDGEKAAEIIKDNSDFDIYILDINLPGKSGIELYEQIIAETHRPVIFMSGYSKERIPVSENQHIVILQKPFAPRELLEKLVELIDNYKK